MINPYKRRAMSSKVETLCDGKYKFVRSKSGCFIAIEGYLNPEGYAYISIGHNRNAAIHRLVYAALIDLNIKGFIIRHKCDNPICINPDHLIKGTHADNVADRVERDRSAKGNNHGRSKLNDDIVKQIRQSTLSDRQLAMKYGVDRHAINNARRGLTWKHVETGPRQYRPTREPLVRYDKKSRMFYVCFYERKLDESKRRCVYTFDGQSFRTQEIAESFKAKIWPVREAA